MKVCDVPCSSKGGLVDSWRLVVLSLIRQTCDYGRHCTYEWFGINNLFGVAMCKRRGQQLVTDILNDYVRRCGRLAVSWVDLVARLIVGVRLVLLPRLRNRSRRSLWYSVAPVDSLLHPPSRPGRFLGPAGPVIGPLGQAWPVFSPDRCYFLVCFHAVDLGGCAVCSPFRCKITPTLRVVGHGIKGCVRFYLW